MWLETITVRTPAVTSLEQHLEALLDQLAATAPQLYAAVYSRHPSNTDLSFHLLHTAPPVAPSTHGLRLADALRAFGSVDHAAWKQVPANPGAATHSSSETPDPDSRND